MANEDDRRKYKPLEQVLIGINREIISISELEAKRNKALLKSLIEELLIPEMKKIDPLFNEMYTSVFYGGSFYDKLRVKEPNEFDLDLLLRLPKLSQPMLMRDNYVPGYTTLKLNNLAAMKKNLIMLDRYKGLFKLLLESEENPYLDNNKVRFWMEGVVTLALNSFPKSYGKYTIQLLHQTFTVKVHKSGPAFTLRLRDEVADDIVMDIDLVPCFEFDVENLPIKKLRNGDFKRKTFFVVPKPMKNENVPNNNRYWRLSYQEQERELMKNNHQYLKPTIKLLKKLKEKEHPYISSYFIKTVVLLEAEERDNDPGYWSVSLSYVFMTCLKKYYKVVSRSFFFEVVSRRAVSCKLLSVSSCLPPGKLTCPRWVFKWAARSVYSSDAFPSTLHNGINTAAFDVGGCAVILSGFMLANFLAVLFLFSSLNTSSAE